MLSAIDRNRVRDQSESLSAFAGIRSVDTDRVEAARLVWQGESDVDVESLMTKKRDKLTPRDVAKQWLKGFLSSGPQTWEAITEAGNTEGHTEHTLRRARDDLKLVKVKERGAMVGRWQWSLPTQQDDAVT